MMLPTLPCSAFLHLVLPHCYACPDPVANFMIRQAAIRFCEVSKAWRHTGSQVIASNNVTLIAPAHTVIHTIEKATLNGNDLVPVGFLQSEPDQLTGLTSNGRAISVTQESPGAVQVEPFQTGTLRYSLTLKPASDQVLGTFPGDPLRDARDTLPQFIFDQHAKTIAAGAVGMILMLPEQPFSDPKKALLFQTDFETKCASAHVDARMGQQRAPRRNTVHWL